MHVVILTQYFPPETGAPQHRLGFLARRLRHLGHEVTVVTAMPSYPTGRVFDGWRGRVLAREDTEFGTVLRSWVYASPNRTTLRQLATYATFAATALTALFRVRRADVVVWESPPLSLAPAAWVLARRTRAALVMNVSDLWPRSAVELGMMRAGGVADRLFTRLEAWAYRAADLVSAQTDGIVAGVVERAPSARTFLFPNGVDLSAFRPRLPDPDVRSRLGADGGSLLVGYIGNFGRAQALEQVVEAALLAPDIRFALVGDGPRRPDIVRMVQERGAANVVIADPVPHAEVPALLASLDVGLVVLADRDVFEGARPSKLFELLAMGLPVVYAGRGEGARLARESGAAEVVPPERPAELAAALQRLPEAGERGRQFVADHFDRRALTDSFAAALASVVEQRRPPFGEKPS